MAAKQALLVASVISSLHIASALEAESEGPEHVDFHSFMHKYDRQYEHGSGEYHSRLALFSRRVAEARAHNAQPDRLWTAGVNALTDRTEEELAQLRGWQGAAAAVGSGARSWQRLGRGTTFLSQRSRGQPLPREFMNWTSLKASKTILDQGGCGSCWATSSAAVLQHHFEIYSPDSKRTFSPQELVSCVPNPHKCGGTGGCAGATVELAFHWALTRGLAQESETPYRGSTGSCKKPRGGAMLQLGQDGHDFSGDLTSPGVRRASEGAPGLAFGMHGWERLPENSYEPLLRALVERGPVGVSVAARSWAMYTRGVFNGCQRDAVIDHAVVLTGYGEDKKLNRLFYLIQNSWGPAWGEDGHIRLLRSEGDGEHCGVDHQPEEGTGCEGGPKQVRVCGMCGVLYDTTVPYFAKVSP